MTLEAGTIKAKNICWEFVRPTFVLLAGLIPTGVPAEDGGAAKFSPVGDEFRVNSYTRDCQENPAVAVDADGDFVVVWQSDGSGGTDSSGTSIQSQRYASDGSPLGGQFQVNSYTTSSQEGPAVAVDADGDFVVVWSSVGSVGTDSSGTSIQGQRFASDGSPLGGQFQVNSYTTHSQDGPAVAVDADADFVVVWNSSFTDGSSSSIQGQRFASDGSPLGGQFQVNSYTTSSQDGPAVAVDADGDFVVVWSSFGSAGTDSSYDSVQGQRFASDGSPLGGEFQINSFTSNNQFAPAVAVDADGDFVVVWESIGSGGTDLDAISVQGQRFASDGSPLDGEFQINTQITENQEEPAVAVDANSDFVVVWTSYGSGGTDSYGTSIQGQRYASDGSPLGGEFQVNSFTQAYQFAPAIAMDGDGRFVVVWTSEGGTVFPAGTNIQGQRYRSRCTTGTTLCLNDDRFRVEVDWLDFNGNMGEAQVVPVDSMDSGLFYFFSPNNWEMLVKVLDGCSINNHFWVFAAATTNVEYTLRVTDTETGSLKEYFNPLGTSAPAITDIAAFPTCS